MKIYDNSNRARLMESNVLKQKQERSQISKYKVARVNAIDYNSPNFPLSKHMNIRGKYLF